MSAFATLRLKLRLSGPRLPINIPWTEDDLGAALIDVIDMTDYGTSRVTDDGGGLISKIVSRKLGHEYTAATTARPTYTTAYCGGRGAFLFDGVANCLRNATNVNQLPVGANPSEIWVMFESVGVASGSDELFSYGSVTNGLKRIVRRSSTERLQVGDGTTNPTGSGVTASTEGVQVAGGIFKDVAGASHVKGRIQGGERIPQTALAATLNTGTTRAAIGSSNSATATNFFTGAISKILICTELTLDERERLESMGYRDMGALDTLPEGHTYENGPDSFVTFASVAPGAFSIVGTSFLPFRLDFRALDFLPNQITCVRAAPTYDYDVAGALQEFPVDVAGWNCHHPVSHEPFGLQNFSSNSQYGTDRTAPANQTISLTAIAGPIFSAYVLGSGTMRLIFPAPVALLDALGNVTGTTDDLTIDAVDPNADGYQAGAQLFRLSSDMDIQLVFSGSNSFFQIDSDLTTPPMLAGNRRTSLLTSPIEFVGLPRNIDVLNAVFLLRPTHVRLGGTYCQIDDNTSPGPNQNSRRKAVWNYLGYPNSSNPDKAGQMGITIDNLNDDDDAAGVDPLDVLMAANEWRCFATCYDRPNGIVRVCANGGAVREEDFDPADFPPDGMRMVRWMLQMFGAPPQGYLGGAYFDTTMPSAVELSAQSASGGIFTYT